MCQRTHGQPARNPRAATATVLTPVSFWDPELLLGVAWLLSPVPRGKLCKAFGTVRVRRFGVRAASQWMPRVRQDGREAWQRRHGDASVGAVDSSRPGSRGMGVGGRARSASVASLKCDGAAHEPASAVRTAGISGIRREGNGRLQRPPSTARDVRVARRAAARERKAAVRMAQQAAIQRRAEELAAARASAEDNSALDALIAEVQEKLYQKRGDIARGFLDLFDKNRDGSVDRGEITVAIEELLNKKIRPEDIDGVLARTDTDGDGKVDLNEFIAVLKINDKQTRDIIRDATSSKPSAGASQCHNRIDTKPLGPSSQVERTTQDWLTKRQQELSDAGGIAQIVRRNMLDGGDVRSAVTPPVGRAQKPVGLLEIRAKEAQRRLAEQQAEIDRVEKGGEHERALREIAALKQTRFEARVRIARANRQADAERTARIKDKAEK